MVEIKICLLHHSRLPSLPHPPLPPLPPPLCSVKPPLSSHQDAVQLMENLADNFEGVVQYNKDNKLFEVGPCLLLPFTKFLSY